MLQPRNRHIEKWPFLIINSIQNVRAFKCQKLRTPLASLALCVIDIGSLKLTKIPLSMKEFTLSKYDTKKKTCEIHTVNNILFSCEMYVYRQTVLLAIILGNRFLWLFSPSLWISQFPNWIETYGLMWLKIRFYVFWMFSKLFQIFLNDCECFLKWYKFDLKWN